MANENDIFVKMNALLRKHQNSAPPPPPPEPPVLESPETVSSFSEPTQPINALDIPILTEVFVEDDPIPVLTDTLEIAEMQALEASLELDLDPYYTATFHPEPAPHQEEDSASLTFEAMDRPSLISEEITFPDFPQIESEFPDLHTHSAELAEPSEPQGKEENAYPEHLGDIIETEPETSTQASQAQVSDSLTEQILRSIDQHLQKAIEKSVAPQLANSLDKALSSMLDQFSMHIEEMVRETISLELQKQLTAMLDVSTDTDPTSTTPNNSAHSSDSV